jgi:hypothetical protein
VGIIKEFSKRLLVESGRRTPKTGSSKDGDRDINVDSFFNPNGFTIVNLLPQWDSFTAQYFIDQILKPLSQEHSMKSADIARRNLRLDFDNSRCNTAKIVADEMTRLKCKRVSHLPYSSDMAIAGF